MSNVFHELREMLMHELKTTTENGPLTKEKLETIDKLTHSIKSIDTICAMEDKGYSRDDGNSYRNYRSYNSYADGRSMVYMPPMPPIPPIPNNSYSYDGSYAQNGNSYHDNKGEMMYRLEEMLKMANTDKEREAIRMCMNKMSS